MKHAPSFSLILPNIRSGHNVGAMFRAGDACGVDHIYLVGYTAAPPHPQVDKVSLGAEKWVPWSQYKNLKRLVRSLQKRGVEVVALEQGDGSRDIGMEEFTAPLALIVGNEVEGVPKAVLALCDRIVHIPMLGKKESLNVSIAAGIAMYVIAKGLQGLRG